MGALLIFVLGLVLILAGHLIAGLLLCVLALVVLGSA